MQMSIYKILITLLLWAAAFQTFAQSGTSGERLLLITVTDRQQNEPLSYASCVLLAEDGRTYSELTGDDGVAAFSQVPEGRYALSIFYMGQTSRMEVTVNSTASQHIYAKIEYDPIQLDEVVVTASETKTLAATSKIGTDAIRHIQPSSISDLLELLPGGRSSDPDFSAPQSIRLREATPVGENYNTSSLGTQFLIDGIPMSNDANLQYTPATSNYGTSFVNSGVDLRSVSTDDIESVEVIRGIPSVEYGDLTSGMVKVTRRKGGTGLNARFKADMSSKLFYAGKGFEWGKSDRLSANISLNYLDSKSDPRNTRQSYNRMTGSLRVNKIWSAGEKFLYTLGGSVDYTGSFDSEKSDKNLDNGNIPIERYKSGYNRIALSTDFRLASKDAGSFFQSLAISASMTSEKDIIDRWKYVAMTGPVPLSTDLEEGEHDASIVPSRYEATLRVEGKPFYLFVKSVADFEASSGNAEYRFKAGMEWNMNKNYGKGTIFDKSRPFSVDMNMRPRSFNSIPSQHKAAVFVENSTAMNLGRLTLKWMAGLRSQTIMHLGKEYDIQGKIYLDPRLNIRLELPEFTLLGEKTRVAVAGGTGWHTKMPTMDQLFPETIYYDITQLNYWPSDESKRRINMRVYKIDPTNFALKAARNFKWEIRTDLEWNGCYLSVTYFTEDMKSGFRSSSKPVTMTYKDYDESAIDGAALAGPPALEDIPYVTDTLLTTFSYTTNGSRTQKRGVEFTLTTPRIKSLKTKFTVTGAWFRTLYSNSMPEYYRPSMVIDGEAYPYIGYYEDEDGYLREMFNTNFTADTQIPRLGLIFSTSFQCLWFTGGKSNWRNPYPIEYIDKANVRHPFTEASAADGVLSALVREYNTTVYDYERVPFCMNINLKVTKRIYRDKIALAVFANKILDYNPSYRNRYGSLVRREVSPYFGMELNFNL